jgi:hypothetical protein
VDGGGKGVETGGEGGGGLGWAGRTAARIVPGYWGRFFSEAGAHCGWAAAAGDLGRG